MEDKNAPSAPQRAWFKRTWVVAAATGIVGLTLGTAAGAEDVKSTPEYASVATQRDEARDALADAEQEIRVKQADLEQIAGDLPAREGALADAEQALTDREASVNKGLADREAAVTKAESAVAKSEKAVAKREKAVGVIEKEIEANTIGGEGLFEVGVEMKGGTYKTSGSADCYYAVLGDANGNDIKSNNITSGPATVSVARGEFFETNRCADWVLQR